MRAARARLLSTISLIAIAHHLQVLDPVQRVMAAMPSLKRDKPHVRTRASSARL